MSDSRLAVLLILACLALSATAQEPPVRDPMRPPVVLSAGASPVVTEQGLALTGVLVSDSRRIAVINGRFYRVGDRVNGDEILAIEPGSIRIRRNDEEIRVRIRKDSGITAMNDGEQGQ